MKLVTYPYGTTRKAKVFQILGRSDQSISVEAHLVEDEKGEGHVLIGGAFDSSARAGDSGVLTFTKGGPTGGYWKFTKT